MSVTRLVIVVPLPMIIHRCVPTLLCVVVFLHLCVQKTDTSVFVVDHCYHVMLVAIPLYFDTAATMLVAISVATVVWFGVVA